MPENLAKVRDRAWASLKVVKAEEATFWWLRFFAGKKNSFGFTIFVLVLASKVVLICEVLSKRTLITFCFQQLHTISQYPIMGLDIKSQLLFFKDLSTLQLCTILFF